MVHDAVAVSAPGKVLLAGGYLVLDRAYTGLVFGLNARIHVVVRPIDTRSGVVLNEIVVNSPQFENAVWEYGYRQSENEGGIRVVQLRVDADLNLNRNIFIETALGYALSYISSINGPTIKPASVTILADNDYYSTPAELSNGTDKPASNSKPLSRFHNFAVPLREAHKTGLGSSAALVTAFIGALLSYYLPAKDFDLSDPTSRTGDVCLRRLHNLAQAAHCAAQGKVGSGFDVASAVHGSCLYRRFSPSILSNSTDPGTPGFTSALRQLVEEAGTQAIWDTEIYSRTVRVPEKLRLVMCDVSHGSQTPGMVKQVLAWRKEKPEEADGIWGDLHHANESLATELSALAPQIASSKDGEVWITPDLGLERLQACFARIREGMRLMSEKSGVPIEPPPQTALLDACERIPGVVGGVVPGAGGYDAIALLIEDKESVVAALKELLATWKFEEDSEGSKVSMLGVREEMQGVKVESWLEYKEWLQ